MCGIVGIISLNNEPIANGKSLVNNMLKAIKHRGPDDIGVYENENATVFLGHVRLSILDLSNAASQPMHSTESVLTYNGELYNFEKIKNTLKTIYYSTSDTEVLQKYLDANLKNYTTTEISNVLNKFNGMFGFAHYNKHNGNTLVVRDHSGEKQLYYTHYNNCFVFASEIKAILTLPFIKKEVDKQSLYNFLTFSYNHPPQTLFSNICKIPPAHFISIKQGKVFIENYWNVSYNNELNGLSEFAICDLLLTRTEDVIKQRLVSDVPIGLFLSGGVDSSAIAHYASNNYKGSISTFTAGFEGMPMYNELNVAEEIAKKYNTNHNEVLISKNDIAENLSNIAEAFDDALADAPSIPIYFIAKKAKEQNIKVVLNGDGPDELLFGYTGNWPKYAKYARMFTLYAQLPKVMKKTLTSIFEKDNEVSPFNELLQRGLNNSEFFWGGASTFKDATKNNFLTNNFLLQVDKNSSYDIIKFFKEEYNVLSQNSKHTYADWMSFLGYKAIIPNYYTLRADRLGMTHGVEVRSPFLDKDFVQLALNIPFKYKYKNNISKYIFKKSLEPILSKDILYRGKMGFNVPLREWIHDTIIHEVSSQLKSFCINTDVFQYDKINYAVEQLKKGNIHYTRQVWCVYFLMHWYKKYLNI